MKLSELRRSFVSLLVPEPSVSRSSAPEIQPLSSTATRELVDRAAELAARVHGGQNYGDQPYTVHLEAVVATLREFWDVTPRLEVRLAGTRATSPRWEAAPSLEVIAWLHDTLEDTKLSAAVIESQFGPRVREEVERLTFRRGMSDGDYFSAMSSWAFPVKMADRIANLRAIGRTRMPGEAQRKVLAKYVRQLTYIEHRAGVEDLRALQAMRRELRAAESRLRGLELQGDVELGFSVSTPEEPDVARYHLVAGRPVKIVVADNGGITLRGYDPATGGFVDEPWSTRVFSPYDSDIEVVSQQEFDQQTQARRAKLI